jgi:uncharacterized membrane protein YdjX (TVP38/TMEM64 family)
MVANAAPGSCRLPGIRVWLGLVLTAGLVTLGILHRTELAAWVEHRPLLFPAVVFLAQLLFIPRITMLVISGLLFAPLTGALLTLMGDTAAALVVWAWSRWSFSDATDGFMDSRPTWRRVRDALVGRSPVLSIAVLRILPISHFSTVSLVSGALRLRLPAFVLGTVLGCIPTALFYAFAADRVF